MSSRTKRTRAEPERKSLRKTKKVKYTSSDEDEPSGDEAYGNKEDLNDELQGISTNNIIQGRRTRGVKVDYTKAAPVLGEDDGDDGDEDEPEEVPKKRKTRAIKPTSTKQSKIRSSSKSKVARAANKPDKHRKNISSPKKRAVVDSDVDEQDASSNHGDQDKDEPE